MDTTTLGTFTAGVMDSIAERFGDDAKILTLAVVVEVEDSEDHTEILVCSNEPRAWVQLAFINEARISLERQMERAEEEAE